MTPVSTDQEIESRVCSLYQNAYATTLVHFAAAAFLIYTLLGPVHVDLIIKWSAALVGVLLVSVLTYSLFNRKRTTATLDYSDWEIYYGASSFAIGSVFAAAYSYAIITSEASLHATLALIFIMQISCVLLPIAGSSKAIALTASPIALPVIISMFIAQQPGTLVLATSIFVYCAILTLVMLNVNRSVNRIFALETKYANALNLVTTYKKKLDTSTIEDPQTQILNRRFFDFISGEEIRRAKRASNRLSIAIIAIDAFDEYFTHYGEEKAARCLRMVAKLLAKATPRGGEYVMRFDDTRFVLLAPNIKTSEAIAFTTKMMDMVCGAQIEHIHSTVENWETVSISIGISEYKAGDLIGVDAMIDQAVFALQKAIDNGGNCTKLFAMDLDTENAQSFVDEVDTVEAQQSISYDQPRIQESLIETPESKNFVTNNLGDNQTGDLHFATDNLGDNQTGNLHFATNNLGDNQTGNLHFATNNLGDNQTGNLHFTNSNDGNNEIHNPHLAKSSLDNDQTQNPNDNEFNDDSLKSNVNIA